MKSSNHRYILCLKLSAFAAALNHQTCAVVESRKFACDEESRRRCPRRMHDVTCVPETTRSRAARATLMQTQRTKVLTACTHAKARGIKGSRWQPRYFFSAFWLRLNVSELPSHFGLVKKGALSVQGALIPAGKTSCCTLGLH